MSNIDLGVLSNISYGLYVVTVADSNKQNGLIVNTVFQLTDNPLRIGVAVNKNNYSFEVIKKTAQMNVCCLSVDTPFSVFENFGFRSGKDINKFENIAYDVANNGIAYLKNYINSYISLDVVDYVDLGTHGLFICSVTESVKVSKKESMTYAYYHEHVKNKIDKKVKGYVCTICGFVYDGEELPEDYVCPLCLHGASYFEKL